MGGGWEHPRKLKKILYLVVEPKNPSLNAPLRQLSKYLLIYNTLVRSEQSILYLRHQSTSLKKTTLKPKQTYN